MVSILHSIYDTGNHRLLKPSKHKTNTFVLYFVALLSSFFVFSQENKTAFFVSDKTIVSGLEQVYITPENTAQKEKQNNPSSLVIEETAKDNITENNTQAIVKKKTKKQEVDKKESHTQTAQIIIHTIHSSATNTAALPYTHGNNRFILMPVVEKTTAKKQFATNHHSNKKPIFSIPKEKQQNPWVYDNDVVSMVHVKYYQNRPPPFFA